MGGIDETGAARRGDAETWRSPTGFTFARRALMASVIAAGVVVVLLLLWYAVDVLLLVFAGVLFGVLLRGLSRMTSKLTGLGNGWSLAVASVLLAALLGLTGWLLAGRIAEQANDLVETLPRAVEQSTARLRSYSWGAALLAELPPPGEWGRLLSGGRGGGGVFGRITGVASGVFGALVNFVVIGTIGLYLAAEPRTYRRGVMHLVPPRNRKRAREVLMELDTTLGRWLIGRLILMLVNGSLTALVLWLLDVPLALTLGILTGLLNFIPNFGPLIAGVPAVLIALLVSPQVALHTALLFLAVQVLDGYVFTPLVDRRSVELPPVLTISAQVFLGVLVGTIGVVLASPLIASLIVLVRMLYVEDTLGDEVKKDDAKINSDADTNREETT